jgi:hypothetical protein
VSRKLVARSPDLKRLQDEGYDLKVTKTGGHLLVSQVPYLNASRQIKRGVLVSVLETHEDRTRKPDDHTVWFIGERPCDASGAPLGFIISEAPENLAEGVTAQYRFSTKPTHGRGYADYHDKVATYVKILSHAAQAVDPNVNANMFPVIEADEDDPVFKYFDSASSRAGIDGLSPKLALSKIAIVGVGGTGGYVLDLVAKTSVREIHLFDDDFFLQHNAFRSPGAVAFEELKPGVRKVEHFQALYSKLRHGVIAHPYRITASNVGELSEMKFVFLCLDSGEIKDAIMTALESAGTSFIDVGMGIQRHDGALHGILRVTTSTPQKRDHVRGNNRVSFAPTTVENEYNRNIQVADLNALNATLAVVKWKKLCGFYHDLEHEHHSTYMIETSKLSREDQ